MRKVLKNHNQVAHFWANKVQSEGKASNMFFESDIIYSYGYHFPIAKHIKKDVVLFTSDNYSVSTSQHKSIVRQSIPHNKIVLTIPIVDGGKYSSFDLSIEDHKKNVKYYDSMLKHNMKKSLRATKNKQYYLNSVVSYIEELRTYLKIFRIKSKLPNKYKVAINIALNMDLDNIKSIVKVEQQQQKKAEAIRKAEQKKKFFKKLKEWRNGEINNLPYYEKQYLRINKDNIQTSLNVNIELETFKKYYAILKRGKSLVNEKISHYRVNKQDDKLLTIGCHKIEIAEIHSIAEQIKGV
tara:strand:- start:122 stop:1009 length:888 start_codon:yes stop_codon:yes gene_type:complete